MTGKQNDKRSKNQLLRGRYTSNEKGYRVANVRLSKDTKVLKGKRGGTVWSREATLLSSRHKWYLEYERKCKNKPFI